MRSDDVGLFQFYEPQNESSKPTEKGNSVRRFNSQDPPLLCAEASLLQGRESLGPPGIIFCMFLTSHVSHIQHLMSC